MRMKSVLFACTLCLSSCVSSQLDLTSLPFPVMVSPNLRVGDTTETRFEGEAFGTFQGAVESSSASGAATYYELQGGDVYRVSESYYGYEESDTVHQSLARATGGRGDVLVIVKALKAVETIHMSLIGVAHKEVSVEGTLYDPSEVRFGEQGQ